MKLAIERAAIIHGKEYNCNQKVQKNVKKMQLKKNNNNWKRAFFTVFHKSF